MKSLFLRASLAALSTLAASALCARAEQPPADFVFVAGGDMIGPYHAFPGPEDKGFASVAALFQSADLGFANQEGSIFDLATFSGWPAAENGGGYPLQPRDTARSIHDMGVHLVSKANNHATDYGTEGLIETLDALDDAGVTQGGAGMSEAEARGPAYVATSKGKAALVAAASTFPPMAAAGAPVVRRGRTTKPRPGISVLHVRDVRLASASEIATLRRLGADGYSKPGEARIGDQMFRSAADAGTAWEMSPADEGPILEAVRQARANAAFVLVSIHAHETAGREDVPPPVDFEPMVLHRADEAPSPNDPKPAGFEPVLFHAVIDAGADAVVRTGPHVLGGIEIYAGRPIFYGLGSLFFDFGGRRTYTTPAGETQHFPDAWFDAFIPVSIFRNGRVTEIKIHPVTISADNPETSGVPHPADEKRGRVILERVRALSAALGTKVSIVGGLGVVKVD